MRIVGPLNFVLWCVIRKTAGGPIHCKLWKQRIDSSKSSTGNTIEQALRSLYQSGSCKHVPVICYRRTWLIELDMYDTSIPL